MAPLAALLSTGIRPRKIKNLFKILLKIVTTDLNKLMKLQFDEMRSTLLQMNHNKQLLGYEYSYCN